MGRVMNPTAQGRFFGRQMEEAKNAMQSQMIAKEVAKADDLNEDDLYLLRRTYSYYMKHGPWTNSPNEVSERSSG